MTDLKTRFETAAADVQKLATRPDNEALLRLYALYKQATGGDVSGSRPGILDIAARAKFDAWTAVKGMKHDQAMQSYIDFVEQLKKSG